MNLDDLRRFCLAFPQAAENLQWGEALCFKVSGKLFVVVDLGSAPPRLTLKCTPEKFAELIEQEGISPAPYLGRYKWAALQGLDALPAEELEDLIRQSYELVTARIPRKKKNISKNRAHSRKRKTR